MAALPIITFDRGFQSINRGTLHDCAPEFLAKNQMAFYQGCKPGWSKCPLGYWVFSTYDEMGKKLVVPAVILLCEKAPSRKFYGHSIKFNKEAVEAFIAPHLILSATVKGERDSELKNLAHDLRAIGAEIYNTTLTAKSHAEYSFKPEIARALDNVLAAQQMMSLRLDIVDYESGYSSGRPKELIPVFKKIDKVLRAFQNRFSHVNMRYKIEGTSFASTFGPPIFEIIPFVIVENAIKYSPKNNELLVRYEVKDSELFVRFESLGPKISEVEKAKIFDRHYRGEAAILLETEGSGIGLYAAKTLIETHFHGRISVNQSSNPVWIDRDLLYQTRFTLILPIANNLLATDSRPFPTRRAFARR